MHVPRVRTTFFLLIALLSGTALFALGCRAAPPLPNAPETPAASDAGKTTLTLWHTFSDEKRKTLEDMAKDFHKVYPDLTINPVYVGNRDDLTKQMTAALALGNPPDLILADRRQIADLAQQGGLESLEQFIDDPELGLTAQDHADFLPGMLDLGRYRTLGNRVYGLPFDQEALVLFYNADLLKTINVNRAPRTWDQFADTAATVSNQDVYGWTMRAHSDTFEAMLASRGSALLTDAETRALFNERAGLASLKLIAELNEGGAAEMATSDDKARAAFASGKVAYYMGWMSEWDTLQAAQKEAKTNFNLGVAPLPQLDPENPWLLARGDLFGITKIPRERARNAWFFIRWITAPTQSARWVRATDAIPLRASALTFIAPDLPTNARFRQIAAAFDRVLPHLAAQPAHRHMDAVREQIGGLWLQAIQPKADLPAILDNLAGRVNQILAVNP